MGKLTKIFKALSDETRLRMLKLLLSADELCVFEIEEILNIRQPRVSRNIQILHDQNLVVCRKAGLKSLYSINRDKNNRVVSKIVNFLAEELNDDPQIQIDKQSLNNFLKFKRISSLEMTITNKTKK